MTVYVQYHWEYEEGEEEITTDIETQWIDGDSFPISTATEDNNFLIYRPWADNLGVKIITDNIMVTDFKQIFNTMHIYVKYVE